MTRIKELIAVDPEFPVLRGALGHALAKNGEFQAARSILRELERVPSYSNRSPFYAIALIRLALGEHEEARCALQEAYESGSLWSFGIHADPIFRHLQLNLECLANSIPVEMRETGTVGALDDAPKEANA
jgi:hypothetical protein